MTFPPPPLPDPEWRALSTLSPLNGHIESGWNQATGQWSNPEFIQDPYLRVHGLAPVFHYGQEAYEGMKAFRTPDDRNIHIFRPSFHARRLNDSNLLVSIPPVPEAHFLNCVSLAVALNAEFVPSNSIDGMLYIRPVVFGSGPRILLSPTDEYIFCVYVVCAPAAYHGVRPLDALILEDFDRAAPRGVGGGKVGGNYAPVMRWSEQARKEGGWGITLHLDSQTHTHVEEFSTSGFVGVKGRGADVTIVVPDTKNAIRSVTVDSIQTIARQLGWNVECRPIKYEELRDFSEVLACGTAVVVVSVKSVTRKSTGDRFLYQDGRGEPGRVATKLANVLRSIQKGREEDSFGWCARVEGPVELPLGSTRE